MPWFLVDDQYPADERVLATSLAARGLWVTAGAWASAHHTDAVPAHVLEALGSTPTLEAELRTARVWRRVRGAYQFMQPGLCKIPAQETVDKQREMKNERQRRWREGRGRRDVDASTAPSTWSPSPYPYPGVDLPTDTARASPAPVENRKTPFQVRNGTRQPPPVADAIAAALHPEDHPRRGRHARKDTT